MKYLLLFLISFNCLAYTCQDFTSTDSKEVCTFLKGEGVSSPSKGALIIKLIQNDNNGLSLAAKKVYFQSTKDIILALQIDSLDVAKDYINSITPDGAIITQTKKDLILWVFE
jgi:hypothetical protein